MIEKLLDNGKCSCELTFAFTLSLITTLLFTIFYAKAKTYETICYPTNDSSCTFYMNLKNKTYRGNITNVDNSTKTACYYNELIDGCNIFTATSITAERNLMIAGWSIITIFVIVILLYVYNKTMKIYHTFPTAYS